MEYNDALRVIGNPRSQKAPGQHEAEQKFKQEHEPAKQYALKAIPMIEELFRAEVRPFIAEVEAAGIGDSEDHDHMAELHVLLGKPNELRQHLAAWEAVDFSQLNQPSYPNQLDTFRTAALGRHFDNVLSKFGAVDLRAKELITAIRSRIVWLAECGAIPGNSFPIKLTPDDTPEPLKVLSNLPHD